MARTWMTETQTQNGRVMIEMPDYLPVTIYKDSTDLYTEEEITESIRSNLFFDEMVEIPVPNDLLKQWWYECLEFDRKWGDEPEGGWAPVTDADFLRWVWEESTADDTINLYDWLCDHNYFWKRLD